MTASELKNKIFAKGWFFRFKSENPLKKNAFGWKNLELVDKEYGGFEPYLKKISESQGLKSINIEARSKNGTGWTNRGIWCVETETIGNIGKIEPVKTNTSINPINSTNSTKNTETNISNEDTKSTTMEKHDLTTHIENASMKTELRFLQADNDRLKESNKKLDQKNEELFNEVSKLTRELATDKTKNDLEFQKKTLELEKGQKSGLSGIVDEIKNMDPETIALFGSFIQPNNKNFQKFLEKGKSNDNNDNSGEGFLNGTPHENKEVQEFIEQSIYPMLTSASPAVVGMLGGLIEYFTKNETGNQHLAATYKKWLPGAVPDMKGTEENLEEEEEKED